MKGLCRVLQTRVIINKIYTDSTLDITTLLQCTFTEGKFLSYYDHNCSIINAIEFCPLQAEQIAEICSLITFIVSIDVKSQFSLHLAVHITLY